MTEHFDLNALRPTAEVVPEKTTEERIAGLRTEINELEEQLQGPDNRERFRALTELEQQRIVHEANEGQVPEEQFASPEDYLSAMDSDRSLIEVRLEVKRLELAELLQA